jgi:hypothetical protein
MALTILQQRGAPELHIMVEQYWANPEQRFQDTLKALIGTWEKTLDSLGEAQ